MMKKMLQCSRVRMRPWSKAEVNFVSKFLIVIAVKHLYSATQGAKQISALANMMLNVI